MSSTKKNRIRELKSKRFIYQLNFNSHLRVG